MQKNTSMNRRKMVKNTLLGLTAASLLSGFYAWQIEPFNLEFVRLKMPIKNLPDHLVGKTVMQISDIHIGNRFNHQFVIDSFQKAQQLHPDFVVYTGDYVSTYKDQVIYEKLAEKLEHIVLGNLGTVGILGNHDYGKSWLQEEVASTICSMLEKVGVAMLRNKQQEIAGLNFIGFDDYWGMNFKPEEAMDGFDAKKATITLCHNPDVCDLPVWGDYNSWILSRHTHGGQVKAPFLPPFMLPVKNKRYSAGKFSLSNGRTLYINRALGHLWQVRFNVRPEITLFTLERES